MSDSKGKWAHFPSPMEKANKSKVLSLPLDLVLGPSKVPTMEAKAKGKAYQDLAGTSPLGISEALEVG